MDPRLIVERVKQRKLGQWTLTYLAGAWLLLQVLALLAQPFAWPDRVLRVATVVLAIGLLAVLVLAWYHGERGRQRVTSVELLMLAGILVLAGAAVTLVGRNMRPAATAAATGSPAGAPMVSQGSIAVLPFANESPDPAQGYFADGLTDELLNVLGELPELRVAARTSSFAFRGKDLPADSIARALHVANLLEGSVRKDGMRVRISADLIDASTGYTLWRETYDRDVKDVFQVQDEISHSIVSALRVRLAGGRAGAQMAREETGDARAHLYALEAMHLARTPGRTELAQAEGLFHQAIQRDARYARAWAGLASVHWLQGYYRFTPADPAYEQARREATQALRLDSTIAEAHLVLGRIADVHDWRFNTAQQELARAIELNPALADAYCFRAWLLMRLGRTEEAIADARHAVMLDPLSAVALNTLGAVYAYSGQPERSLDAAQEAIALAPQAISPRANQVEVLSLVGRNAEAVARTDTLLRLSPDDPIVLSVAAYAYARAGRRAQAEALLSTLQRQRVASPYLLAIARQGLGDRAGVVAALGAAVRSHDDYVPDLGVDPVFASYRRDPRVLDMLEAMGLPTSAASALAG